MMTDLNRETLKKVIWKHEELLTAEPEELLVWCRHLLDSMSDSDRALVSRLLHHVRRERTRLVEVYANRYYFQLRLESRISTTPRLTRLFELASDEDGAVNRDRLFEGLSVFLLSVGAACLETELPEDKIGQELDEIIDLFKHKMFRAGRRNVQHWTYHEKRTFRVHEGEVGIGHPLRIRQRLECRQKPLTCNFVTDDLPVFIDDRPKGISALFKIFYQLAEARRDPEAWAGRDPFFIADRAALLLAVPVREDVGRLLDALNDTVATVGGAIEGDEGIRNPQSSPHYKVDKVFLRLNGVRPEVQIPTLARLYSGQCALDDENHDLYKLKRCLKVYFPTLFPELVYGIQWSAGRTQHRLSEDRRAALRNRIRELRT